MSPTLSIGTALSDGIDRLNTRGGLTLLAVLALLQVVTQVALNSLFEDLTAGSLPSRPRRARTRSRSRYPRASPASSRSSRSR
ncbi:hypothetical protein ACFQRB_08215 [Halobaculum litoreum]|uniref:Uncharacterized protein n=1 Tax=Halobaculum litoreum TaxID=3031998 RepID=A0ABD5XN79_9EURY